MVVASQLVFYPHKIPQNKNGTVRILLLSVPNIVDPLFHIPYRFRHSLNILCHRRTTTTDDIGSSRNPIRNQIRKALGHQGSELKFKTPWYPVVPWLAFITSTLSCFLIWFDPAQRIALYYTVPFVLICYFGYQWYAHHSKTKN